MKYFTVAALAVVGIAAMPRPESEIWGNFEDYEGLNEDCYDDEVGQVQSGFTGDDLILPDDYNNDECDDGPIDQVDLIDVNIQPQYPDVDLKIPLSNYEEAVDEECEEEIVTEAPNRHVVTEPEEPPCYDENGDLIDTDEELDYGNEYNDLEDIIENAEHGFSDLDLIINTHGDIEVQNENEGYDGCLEDY